MVKRTVTFDDYEGREYDEYTGDDPKPGAWYTGEVVRAKYLEEDDQVVFYIRLVDHPDYEGWVRGVYAPFEGERKFVMQELVKALQGGAEKDVTLDWANERAVDNWLKKAKRIRFQTRLYNDTIKIGKTRALLNNVAAPAKAAAPAPSPAATPAEDDPEPYTRAELEEITDIAELEEILEKEFEVADDDFPAQPRRDPDGSKYKAALIDAILEEQDGDDNQDAVEDAADNPDDGEFDDGFDDGEQATEEEPPPAAPARSRRGTKAAPASAAPAPAARTRRTRR